MKKLESWFNEEGRRMVMVVSPPSNLHGEDSIRSGRLYKMSVVAHMCHYMREEHGVGDKVWNTLWRWKAPRKV